MTCAFCFFWGPLDLLFFAAAGFLGSSDGGAFGSNFHCWAVDVAGISSLSSLIGEGGFIEALREDEAELFFDRLGFASSSSSSSGAIKSSISFNPVGSACGIWLIRSCEGKTLESTATPS